MNILINNNGVGLFHDIVGIICTENTHICDKSMLLFLFVPDTVQTVFSFLVSLMPAGADQTLTI